NIVLVEIALQFWVQTGLNEYTRLVDATRCLLPPKGVIDKVTAGFEDLLLDVTCAATSGHNGDLRFDLDVYAVVTKVSTSTGYALQVRPAQTLSFGDIASLSLALGASGLKKGDVVTVDLVVLMDDNPNAPRFVPVSFVPQSNTPFTIQ